MDANLAPDATRFDPVPRASGTRPTFEYVPKAAAGSSSPTAPDATPASQDTPTGPEPLTARQKSQLHREASKRVRGNESPEGLIGWIITQGLPEDEAHKMGTSVWRQDQARVKAARAERRRDMGLAWTEIIGGAALLIIGLSAGWFVGLFLVPIVDGFRRLGS